MQYAQDLARAIRTLPALSEYDTRIIASRHTTLAISRREDDCVCGAPTPSDIGSPLNPAKCGECNHPLAKTATYINLEHVASGLLARDTLRIPAGIESEVEMRLYWPAPARDDLSDLAEYLRAVACARVAGRIADARLVGRPRRSQARLAVDRDEATPEATAQWLIEVNMGEQYPVLDLSRIRDAATDVQDHYPARRGPQAGEIASALRRYAAVPEIYRRDIIMSGGT